MFTNQSPQRFQNGHFVQSRQPNRTSYPPPPLSLTAGGDGGGESGIQHHDDAQSLMDYSGLTNGTTENNCFLNAVIQILYNADVFRRSLRNLAAIELGHYQAPQLPTQWRHRCLNANPSAHLLQQQHQSNNQLFCLFCELVKLFDSLRIAQQNQHQRFHDPNSLRLALQSSQTATNTTFRLNQMNDSVECFEQILRTLHGYTASSAHEDRLAPHSAECTSDTCVCHRQFSLTVSEQKTCSCGLANSELQFASDLVERVYVVPLLRAANRQPPTTSSFSDLLRIAQSSVDPPIVCQGPRCGRLVHKMRRLLCRPDAIAISLTFPSACPDDLTLKQVIDLIEPTVEPSRIYSSASQFPEPFQLSGIICYHGQHYLAICYHSTRRQWNVISDSVVKSIGNSWADVRAYLRRAPCIPCLLLYTNPQAQALPRQPNQQQAEPIYFDRQAVQDMLANSLKYPIHVQAGSAGAQVLSHTQNYPKKSSVPSDSASSGYDSKSSSVASSTHSGNDSSTISSGSPSPPAKGSQDTYQQQAHSTNSLDRLSSLLPLPQLVLPSMQENAFVATRFQQADQLCQKLLAQLNQRQYADSLMTCQQAANVLRSALITNTPNGGVAIILQDVNSPLVVSAKRRIDWLAHYERTILKKIGNPTPQVQTHPHHPMPSSQKIIPPATVQPVSLSTFQTPVPAKPPQIPSVPRQHRPQPPLPNSLRTSLSDLQQQVSKTAEDLPDRCCCGPQPSNGTLPRGLRLSPSSSDILSSTTSSKPFALEKSPQVISTSTLQSNKPRFVAVRGPGLRVQPQPQALTPIAMPPAPPSISSEVESLGCSSTTSGHGSVSSSTLQPSGSSFSSFSSQPRKSLLRPQRASSSSIGSNSLKSVKFNDQVAVITEDFLGPNGDPIDSANQVSVTVEESSSVENYSTYVARLTERTRQVVYPTTQEQSEQFYMMRRSAVVTTSQQTKVAASQRSVAKLKGGDESDEEQRSVSPPPMQRLAAQITQDSASSSNSEEDDDSCEENAGDGPSCALCSKKLSCESQQYCDRCQSYLSRFSTTPSTISHQEICVDEPGITFTAVADGAIF